MPRAIEEKLEDHNMSPVGLGNTGNLTDIRYVDVIWSVFHVPQLQPIRFTQRDSWCISESTILSKVHVRWLCPISWTVEALWRIASCVVTWASLMHVTTGKVC